MYSPFDSRGVGVIGLGHMDPLLQKAMQLFRNTLGGMNIKGPTANNAKLQNLWALLAKEEKKAYVEAASRQPDTLTQESQRSQMKLDSWARSREPASSQDSNCTIQGLGFCSPCPAGAPFAARPMAGQWTGGCGPWCRACARSPA